MEVNITAKRWTAACVLACLVLAVVLLPPQPGDDPYSGWTPRRSAREYGLQIRGQARRTHAQLLSTAYRSAHDVEAAQREFGANTAGAGSAPAIWFDSDVPASVRREVLQRIAAEDSARGSWHGKGRVGVLVFTDTAKSIDGVQFPWGFNRGLAVSTSMLRPSRQTGGRCIAVIRIGSAVLGDHAAIPAGRSLLDGCAFYDAFGSPGPQIAAWMDSTNAGYARVLSFAPPESGSVQSARWGVNDFWYSDPLFARCAADDLAACSELIRLPNLNFMWRYWHDSSVPAPAEAQENLRPARGFSETLLDAMARNIGPERFERVWASSKSLDSAYSDATGERLAPWTHARIAALDGTYRVGPLPTATSAILTIVTIALSLAAAARLTRRPAAA